MLLIRIPPSIEAGSPNPEISTYFTGIADLLDKLKHSQFTLDVAFFVRGESFLHPKSRKFTGSVPRVRAYLQTPLITPPTAIAFARAACGSRSFWPSSNFEISSLRDREAFALHAVHCQSSILTNGIGSCRKAYERPDFIFDSCRSNECQYSELGRVKQKQIIAILGATGVTGEAVVLEALRLSYSVNALVRVPSKLKIKDPSLKVIQGSADNLNVIVELLTGCSAAISTQGPGFDKEVARKMVSTSATRNVIQAMTQLKIKRYIVMSGASVVLSGDRTTSLANIVTRYVFPFLLGDILKDKYSEYELLELSNLDWTLVRCPRLREPDKETSLVIQHTKHSTLWVDKTSLAEFLVSQIESDKFLQAGIFACSKY